MAGDGTPLARWMKMARSSSRTANSTDISPLHPMAGVGQMLWNVTAAFSRMSAAASATHAYRVSGLERSALVRGVRL